MSTILTMGLLLVALATGMELQRRYSRRRARRRPHVVILDYGSDGRFEVTACACNQCKNVIFVQHVEVEQPKFCTYCGVTFVSTERSEERIREYLVPDQPPQG